MIEMENVKPELEVNEILSSLQDGLRDIEKGMSALLEDMATDNEAFLEEIGSALAAAEAVLADD